ncbi:uncharacterized protein [Arachis hypogaea]|uniref:uncharacterized protein n=1 Tax=Arachis hypogaea TaxID=3818 RepID=UPI000DECC6A4|nr:uncharacterized protein LOC112717784 [Arachis hypogaea]
MDEASVTAMKDAQEQESRRDDPVQASHSGGDDAVTETHRGETRQAAQHECESVPLRRLNGIEKSSASGIMGLHGREFGLGPIDEFDDSAIGHDYEAELPGKEIPDLWDAGDPICCCTYCNANMWEQERLSRTKGNVIPHFGSCCMDEKVQLPFFTNVPKILTDLHLQDDEKGHLFRKNIRSFNSMFSFTSMAEKVNYIINNNSGPPSFVLSGQNYHSIGSFVPNDNERPKFAKYMTRRMRSNKNVSNIERKSISTLKDMLDAHNPLAKMFCYARDRFKLDNVPDVRLKLIRKRDTDGRRYNLPTVSEVAALVVGDVDDSIIDRDIIIESTARQLKRIDVLHPQYLALQYPLLFPYAEDGYRNDIETSFRYNIDGSKKRTRISMRKFFSYRVQMKGQDCHMLLQSRRLFQQFLVDAYTMIEAERLNFLRFSQCKLRVENYRVLHELFTRGEADAVVTGQHVCTIEFQKRGLPHAHILLFTHPSAKPKSPSDIGRHISTEIPDKRSRPKLYAVVEKFMVHGPCGKYNKDSPCMINGRCSKFFPKPLRVRTITDEVGFPKYKRVDNGRTTSKRNVLHDNSYIVPYNPSLLLKVTASFFQTSDDGCGMQVVDKIRNYYDCSYISASEVAWRIFGYDIQVKEPAIIRLPFHLPNEHSIVFRDNESIEDVIERANGKLTKLLAWMAANKRYEIGRALTYSEFPNKFVWKKDHSMWVPRKIGFSIDRNVWKICYKHFADDILFEMRRTHYNQELCLTDEQILNLTLIKVEEQMQTNGRSLRDFKTMPYLCENDIDGLDDRMIIDELNFDHGILHLRCNESIQKMTDEQCHAFDEIVKAVQLNLGGFFFLYGYGGTGKIFLYTALSTVIRSKGDIVLNVASNGIAALLLPNGCTAHLRFRIPFNINEDSVCNIKQGSSLARLICKAKFIIWDKAPMLSKYCYEALDKSLKDVLRFETNYNQDEPFGGKVVVLGGDFRQILPVIPMGSRQDIIQASITSYLWNRCKVLKLTKNMRLNSGVNLLHQVEVDEFAKWILLIGDGLTGDSTDGESEVLIPDELIIPDEDNSFERLVRFVYPNFLSGCKEPDYFKERTILAPTLEVVNEVNNNMMESLPGDERIYLSSDSLYVEESNMEVELDTFSMDVLNATNCSGISPHKLKLKPGVPVMLLRNINQSNGLCNRTKLQVRRIGKHVIECMVLTRNRSGQVILIPRINMVLNNEILPFKF